MILFGQQRLPYSSRIEYVEGDGESFIETDLIVDNTLTGEVEFEVVGGSRAAIVVGTNEGHRFSIRQGDYAPESSYWGYAQVYNGRDWYISQDQIIGRHTFKLLTCEPGVKMSYVFDGKQRNTSSVCGQIQADMHMTFMMGNNVVYPHIRIYRAKFETSTQKFDMFPVMVSDKIGLFDSVNGRFFTNAGAGDFIAGPILMR